MQIHHTGLLQVLRKAGEILLSAHDIGAHVEVKPGAANFVTAYDVAVQQFLFEELSRLYPEAAFVGEEADADNTAILAKGLAFVIDPIDGTTNFIKNYRASTVSVALCNRGEPIVGAVLNPYTGELFYAEAGSGAILLRDGEEFSLHVSDCPLSESVLFFGTSPYYKELHDQTFSHVRTLFDHALDLRRSGSAALDLCMLAAGRADLFYEALLSPWDFAAGMLIVREAGGVVTAIDGSPAVLNRKCSVLAGNPRAHEEACRLIR